MTIDVKTEIRRAVDTGKVCFGSEESRKNILKGNGKLIILSNNLPKNEREKFELESQVAEIPVYNIEGGGLELGSVCGKLFNILAMVVFDAGKSKILSVTK